MLFFFELALFLLIMLTLALAEFVSRGLALSVWLTATTVSLVGYVLASRSLGRRQPRPGDGPHQWSGRREPDVPGPLSGEDSAVGGAPARPERPGIQEGSEKAFGPEPLDERWSRTLLYNWRRTNALLLLGVVVIGGWYWLASR